jgi:hypothetical protein
LTRWVVTLALACLCTPAAGRADADPASDFLIVRNVFLPYLAKIDKGAVDRLEKTVKDANQRGFKIRVAVIAQPADLGGVFQLYRKPQRYAEFLGKELVFVYRGRLLIAMPNGFGYSERGEPSPRLKQALVGLPPPGADPNKLVEDADTAVRRLAAAEGHRLPPPKPLDGDGSETRDRVVIAVGVVVCALFVFGGIAVARRLRTARRGTA